MEDIIFISEIVGTIREREDDGEAAQVCATADASYDVASERASVALRSFVRRISTTQDGGLPPPPWLPAPEMVCEHLPKREAADFAKDVFARWVKRVREAIPGSHIV